MVNLTNINCIAFVCNHQRTCSWNEIARLYKQNNGKIKLIAIIYDNIARKLIKPYLFDEIIDLEDEDKTRGNIKSEAIPFLSEYSFSDEWKIDRKFKYETLEYFKSKIILASLNLIEKFPDKTLFFGEISWAYEKLIFTYSQSQQYVYLTPISIRYLNRRWSLAIGNSEEELFANDITKLDKISQLNKDRPDYFISGIKKLSFNSRLKDFIKRGFKMTIPGLLRQKILYLLITPELELLKSRRIGANYSNFKKYYYGFQVQPEASIDYLAPEYIDQYKLCEQIINELEEDEILICKSHPGERNLKDLKQEIRLIFNPKVIFLRTNFKTTELVKEISGAITITGTLGGELAQLQIPTVSLKPIFYNKLKFSCKANNVIDGLNILRNFRTNGLSNKEFSDYLIRHSFEGYPFETSTYGFNDPSYIENFTSILLNLR